jgi:hypothetical protein
VLSDDELASIKAAVGEEIAEARQMTKGGWLDIDGIEHLADSSGNFVYRLILSSPVHFSPDQTVTFHTRRPKDTIQAVIVRSDDEGLVVECQKPLPTDARLLDFSFDASFILKALENFVVEMGPKAGRIASLFASRAIPTANTVRNPAYRRLNEDQSLAVEKMATTPLHLLWGPPGTGKTTTLGTAVVRWLRQKKRVLIVSTSNAAVDVAMRAVLQELRPGEKQLVLRLGTSLDPLVREVTVGGKLAGQSPDLAAAMAKSQDRLQEIRDLVQDRGIGEDRLQRLYAEAQRHEDGIREFNEQAAEATPQLRAGVLVTGCTLAKMVLDAELRAQAFDVVIVDEASMASVLYALAASFLAGSHLVYAGDPKQLPPIVQAKGANALRWFSQNVYDWFGVQMEDDLRADRLSLLRTQYRMTDEIGSVVSRLSYGDLLRHGRRARGPTIEFIDVGADWQTTHYSVREESYYHLAAVPVLHALARLIGHNELLLLSPFRPQRSLLAALAFDLCGPDSKRKISASTIHRAQGSEAKAVVVDLTAHSPQQLVAFFRDKHCERLFNVSISRARDQLVILGNQVMLRELAKDMPFWGRVLSECGRGIDLLPAEEVLGKLEQADDLGAIPFGGAAHLPALYSHQPNLGPSAPGVAVLRSIKASRKLLVLPDKAARVDAGDAIVRTAASCPPVFAGGGLVCVPYRGKWLVTTSPNVSRVLWRIGFSHLAADEVDPGQARRFYCPECGDGDLVLRQYRGEGWFLVCTNGQGHTCHHRRRLSPEDAKLKVRLQGMKCPNGHPLTVRQSRGRMFLGCENYPACKFTQSLSLLEGM